MKDDKAHPVVCDFGEHCAMGDTILVRVTIHEQSLQVSIRQGAQMMMLLILFLSYHLINFFREVAMIQKSKTGMHQHLRRKHAEVALVSSLLLSGLPFVSSQSGPEIIYSVAGED